MEAEDALDWKNYVFPGWTFSLGFQNPSLGSLPPYLQHGFLFTY